MCIYTSERRHSPLTLLPTFLNSMGQTLISHQVIQWSRMLSCLYLSSTSRPALQGTNSVRMIWIHTLLAYPNRASVFLGGKTGSSATAGSTWDVHTGSALFKTAHRIKRKGKPLTCPANGMRRMYYVPDQPFCFLPSS